MSSKNKKKKSSEKRSKAQSSGKRTKPRDMEKSQKTSGMDDRTDNERKRERLNCLNFVRKTFESGPKGLRAEFASMKRGNDFSKMKAFKEAQEQGKNRYKDVGCLDNNRVKLGSPWPHDYIHANYVAIPTNPKRFICTQAPLEKTCADFWFMCLQEKVENIFMLCNIMEKGAKKCHEYYPTEEKQDTLVFKEKEKKVSVKFVSSSSVTFPKSEAKLTKTVVKVEGPEGMSVKVNHYHWIDWPDRGVPPADHAILDLLERARASKNPIVVHCSAGIGRTGSVVMIEYIMDQLASGSEIEDSKAILLKIREQRNNSIQTDFQYVFVHQVMLNFFNKKDYLDQGSKDLHVAFTLEYNGVVT